MNEFENRLRAQLAEQARHAPDGDALAEQIITGLDRANITPIHRHRQWRTWTLPLIAAAAVAAVALALVGVGHLGRTPHHPVAASTSTRPSSTSVLTPSPTGSPTITPPSQTSTVLSQDPAHLLTNVRVLDLTFVSNDEGWALATAACLDPTSSTPLCTAMLHTTNGGTSWRSVPTPPANVPVGASCAAPCVEHIRFANDRIGYAFGPATLFMTTDGGTSWTRQTSGADALETLDGNVIRVVHAGQGCPPGCVYGIQTALIGTSAWRSVALPGAMSDTTGVGVALTRTGSAAYLAVLRNTAGGGDARTSLYRSSDNGATWTNSGEPCPSAGATEVDTTQLTSGADSSVTVLCTPRLAQTGQFISTAYASRPGFQPGSRSALSTVHASAATAIGSATGAILLVVDDKSVFRSTDGGQTFARLAGKADSVPAGATWIGFESTTAGRAVSADGRTIWTTRDAGLTWTAHSFG